MQFKHPEILFALLLLIIPVIVHLFQLRRFKKVAFTNVQFLKQVELQTRKSSRLKKFLILISRMLLFTALILAFAQPFLSKASSTLPIKNYIYLDNSYSLQAKGKEGELFNRAIQDIIANTSNLENINLFTNEQEFYDLASQDIKNTLLSLNYSPNKPDLPAVLLKIKSQLSAKENTNNIILISDFQLINSSENLEIDSVNSYYITQLKPQSEANLSIDSVYISDQNNESISVVALLKNYGNKDADVSIALYNEQLLSGKSAVSIAKNSKQDVVFKLPNSGDIKGKLEIDDPNLNFDNSLFFKLQKPDKIKVTAIGAENSFLKKIYTQDEFLFKSSALKLFDYNSLNEQQLLILNELDELPDGFIAALNEFVTKGGSLVIIPPKEANLRTYNKLLNSLRIGSLSGIYTMPLSITKIHFSQPLLSGVFEKKISNFQYPTSNVSYIGTFKNASPILSFQDGSDFISQFKLGSGKVYWLDGPINNVQSNFMDSPLIVPVFYNFGLYSFQASKLYYTIGQQNIVEINAELDKNDVLHLTNEQEDFIPLQRIATNKVSLSLKDQPLESGFIQIINKEQPLGQLAFNYNRQESDLRAADLKTQLKNTGNITFVDTVNGTFATLSDSLKSTDLWRYFLMLALVFLSIELILLKSKLN